MFNRCEADNRCKGFNMDYNRNECQAVTKNSENNLFNLRTSSGVSYFEAICLQGQISLVDILTMVYMTEVPMVVLCASHPAGSGSNHGSGVLSLMY